MFRIGRVGWIALVLFGVYSVFMISGAASQRITALTDSVVSVVVPGVATIFAARSAATTQRRIRWAWVALALGLAAATIAETIWSYYKFTSGQSPFPSAADAAYLVFPVGVLAALLLFPAGGSRQSQSRLVFDGVIVAASLLIVAWLTAMRPIYEQGGKTAQEMFVSLAFPVSHVAALTVAAVVLSRSARMPLTPLALGLACMTLAEVAYAFVSAGGYVATHHVINVAWMAGMVLIMVAAAEGGRASFDADSGSEMPGWASILLPYAPLVLAGIVLAFDQPSHARSPLMLIAGVVLGLGVLARQLIAVAENRRLMSTVADRAMRDPLTGLANRALFQDRLGHALQLRQRDGRSIGILALDLDDFKLVNDSMGHPAGDELLISCATRLQGGVRAGDTVARLGGDEFAVLFEGHMDQWFPLAQRAVDAFDQPFIVDGHELLIRPSAGLAVAGPHDDPNLTADDLLKRADVAMYSAKRSHGQGVLTFHAGMADIDSSATGSGAAVVQLLGKLRQAIDQSDLTLVYQPKFSAQTREVVGVEALLRWPHPDRGLLGPDEFLPMVRQYGLMGDVTDLVLNTALGDAARWHAAGVNTSVAVNLFAPLLGDLDLPRKVGRVLDQRGLGASAVTFEITEDLLMEDLDRAKTVLAQLRERGIRIAIDDFGSGYSALSYLSDLPIDEVKLAADFIAPVLHDQRAATVVRAVIDLAQRLGLVTVAEGVQSDEMASCMAEFGCDVLQGYHFSEPVTADEFLAMFTRGQLTYPGTL